MSESEQFQKSELGFRPRSRIMELLGEQLIKNHTLALFELIKNSYDADSENVSILMLDIDEPDGAIEIQDDGFGMDFKTVENVWMEPAVGHKKEMREKGLRTKAGRIPIGEKGVGRFAVNRLGNELELVTRAAGENEIQVKVNWTQMLEYEYLDDAKFAVVERDPEVFKGETTGTRITVTKLKQEWKRRDIRKLYRSILGMTSTGVAPRSDLGFKVKFGFEPEVDWLSGMFDPETARDQAMFKVDFSLTDDGLKYTYNFQPLDAIKADFPKTIADRVLEERKETTEFFSRKPPDEESWKSRRKRKERPILGIDSMSGKGIGIGPIHGSILAFDLDPEIKARYLKDEMTGLGDFLREQGGIRVYRDGMRVYNYGEAGDDWLGLDHRRIQNPSSKLSNQIILGEVHLDLELSRNLVEKTNREGFIENQAYAELQYAILCILQDFESERRKDKKILRSVISPSESVDASDASSTKSTEELLIDLNEVVKRKKLDQEVTILVKKVTASYHETKNVLLASAGSGLGLTTVFHELERGVRSLHRAISDEVELSKLKEQSSNLVSLLRGAMYMVSRSKNEKLKASKLVSYACSTQELRFKHHNVKFLNGFDNLENLDFELFGGRRLLTTTLVNLIDNAIFWSSQSTHERPIIWIGPSDSLDGNAIVVADNGPGFSDSPQDLIQPFFSRKMDGMGIGLYYANMILKSYGGRLSFPSRDAVDVPQACDGGLIAMVFKE